MAKGALVGAVDGPFYVLSTQIGGKVGLYLSPGNGLKMAPFPIKNCRQNNNLASLREGGIGNFRL
jgi:hypothetical protein